MDWGGITNGRLLRPANGLEVFVTVDRNLEHQQDRRALSFGIILVRVADNKIASYHPIFPALLRAAEIIRPGELIHVE